MGGGPAPRRSRLGLAARAALASVGLLGCGREPATYPVAGVVIFDEGQPVRYGTVEFRHRKTGAIARGQIDPHGAFTLGTFAAGDGALPGAYQAIVVQVFRPEQRLADPAADVHEHLHADGNDEQGEADHDHGAGVWLVAPRFASYDTSGLAAEVKPMPDNRVTLTVQGFSPGRP